MMFACLFCNTLLKRIFRLFRRLSEHDRRRRCAGEEVVVGNDARQTERRQEKRGEGPRGGDVSRRVVADHSRGSFGGDVGTAAAAAWGARACVFVYLSRRAVDNVLVRAAVHGAWDAARGFARGQSSRGRGKKNQNSQTPVVAGDYSRRLF